MRRLSGRARQARNRKILAASDVCHICGQPGADAVDHVTPIARGGTEDAGNLRPAHHDVPPFCNRIKGDKMPASSDRRVVLVCGPPGAGKSTYAHTLGLDVYDLDDPQYNGDDALFRAHLTLLARNPNAKAAVIRTGATRSARIKGASVCRATEVIVLETDEATCITRVKARGRQPIQPQLSGIRRWWQTYQPGSIPLAADGVQRMRRSGSLA